MKKFESEIRVIYADTDAMGIVYHANYIKWFEVGRNEFLRQNGYPYKKIEEENIRFPVISAHIDYKLPAKYDDVLLIKAWVKEIKAATITMGYEILKKDTGDLLVTGTTKHAVTNEKLKPTAMKKINPEMYGAFVESMEDEE